MTGTIVSMKDVLMNDPRIHVDWPLIMKSFEQFSDIKGASGFIKIAQGPSPQEQALMQENEALKQAVQQVQTQMQEQSTQFEAEKQQNDLDKRDADNQQQNEETVRTVTDMAKTATAPQPAPQPVANGSGQMFTDPELGKVAQAITNL